MNIYGKNVVVYGAGASGQSAYGLMREKGARVTVYDDDARVHRATDDARVFDGADMIVVSPGVPLDDKKLLTAKLNGVAVISELELAYAFCKAEIVAVTGTNGKTTTVTLIDNALKEAHFRSQALGNIGTPFSAVADNLDATDVAVVECSSFQLDGVRSFSPDIAVILNVSENHLERHKSMAAYIAAKRRITQFQAQCDVLVYNADDEIACEIAKTTEAQTIPFSLKTPVFGAYISSGMICYKGKIVADASVLSLKGKEVENALAAVAVCMEKGVHPYTLATVLKNFRRPEFRRQKIGEVRGVSVFNDSKSTNVASTLSAAEAVGGSTVLIVGGQDQNEDFAKLFATLGKNVRAVVAFGENAGLIASAAKAADYKNAYVTCSLEEAVTKAFERAEKTKSKNVLFSPAAKSFDMFSSYAERGRKFNAEIDRIKRG